MSFQKIVLAGLFIVVCNSSSKTEERCLPTSSTKEKWQKFARIYAASLVPSVTLGTACGTACHFFDLYGPLPVILDWLICLKVRQTSSESIKKSLADCSLEYDELVFDNAVWLSSWISYLMRCKLSGQTINTLIEDLG